MGNLEYDIYDLQSIQNQFRKLRINSLSTWQLKYFSLDFSKAVSWQIEGFMFFTFGGYKSKSKAVERTNWVSTLRRRKIDLIVLEVTNKEQENEAEYFDRPTYRRQMSTIQMPTGLVKFFSKEIQKWVLLNNNMNKKSSKQL